jgi:hypothetical protein
VSDNRGTCENSIRRHIFSESSQEHVIITSCVASRLSRYARSRVRWPLLSSYVKVNHHGPGLYKQGLGGDDLICTPPCSALRIAVAVPCIYGDDHILVWPYSAFPAAIARALMVMIIYDPGHTERVTLWWWSYMSMAIHMVMIIYDHICTRPCSALHMAMPCIHGDDHICAWLGLYKQELRMFNQISHSELLLDLHCLIFLLTTATCCAISLEFSLRNFTQELGTLDSAFYCVQLLK